MNQFKVIVAGGGDFINFGLMIRKLDVILKNKTNVEIVSGVASGADALGELYAKNNGYPIRRFPYLREFGKRGGMIRNGQMADYADALVAFWDGKSRGTKNMIEQAYAKGLQVRVIKYSEDTNKTEPITLKLTKKK